MRYRIFINAPMASLCPCGKSADYSNCCGRFIDSGSAAPDAESLMRSRYAAFTLQREDYLRATWHPDYLPEGFSLADDAPPKWLGLEVKRVTPIDNTHATVEFVARYKHAGRAFRLHETSRFVLQDGRWYYTDGDIHPK